MKVWKVVYEDSGQTDIYSEDSDILNVAGIVDELSYLEGAYDDEREEFINDIKDARRRGYGEAVICERLHVELVSVT